MQSLPEIKEIMRAADKLIANSTPKAEGVADALMDSLNGAQKSFDPQYMDVIVGAALFVIGIIENIVEDELYFDRKAAQGDEQHLRHIFTAMLAIVEASPKSQKPVLS